MDRGARVSRPWRGAASHRDYTNNTIDAAAPGWRRCLRAFAVWLEEAQCLALSTITVRVGSARSFVETLDGGGVRALRRLDVSAVEDSFSGYAQTHGLAARRSLQAAMRLFLRFAALRKWVRPALADAVPSLHSYRLSGVPRGLTNEAVGTLVTSPKKFARDHALVLLFATYGVRRGQACALRLEDISWANKTISFRPHKGGKAVAHQLTAAVAEQLAKYLQHERPEVDEQAIFLRTRKPYLALGPSAVTAVIRDLMRRVGVTSTPCGPHALRHAFATRLLQGGQPLKVIADLLGHRSLDAASIYAKVDHPRMLEIAAEWPEVSS